MLKSQVSNIAMWQDISEGDHEVLIFGLREPEHEDLNSKTFLSFAMRHYNNPNCVSVEEFQNDLATIIHAKKLIKRYKKGSEVKIRLLLNHLTMFYNVFGPPLAATRMLVSRMDGHLEQLKPLLMCLGYWADSIPNVNGKTVISSDISLDEGIVSAIRTEFKGLR